MIYLRKKLRLLLLLSFFYQPNIFADIEDQYRNQKGAGVCSYENSQFYSLVVDGIEDAKVEGGKITIAVNFISEQILGDNEENIVKNKDTWIFEKPENSKGPSWTLVST